MDITFERLDRRNSGSVKSRFGLRVRVRGTAMEEVTGAQLIAEALKAQVRLYPFRLFR